MPRHCLRSNGELVAKLRPALRSQDTAPGTICHPWWAAQTSLASASHGHSPPHSGCPPRPTLRPGEKVNEVMSPQPRELPGASSRPTKAFIGFVKHASCGQGPPGTDRLTEEKPEEQTMKLKGFLFPELRLTHANGDCASPLVLPTLLPRPPRPCL